MARMSGGQSQTHTRNTGQTNSGSTSNVVAQHRIQNPIRSNTTDQPVNTGPTPPKDIKTPKLPDNSTAAEARYWDRVRAGEDWANQHFAEGSMGRMTDPRAADMQNQLDLLRERQQGMNSQEELAAREQAESEINRTMAANLERYAGTAGSQGVRGGAAAALQGRAYTEAGQQMNDFQRKLILDNIAIKQQASDRYGSLLGQQQNTELGLQQFNIGQANNELYGRTATPFQIASGINAQEGAMDANSLNQAQLTLGTRQANDARRQTFADSQQSAADRRQAGEAQARAEAAAGGGGGTIICTESYRQKRFSLRQLVVTRNYRERFMTEDEYQGYLHWATPVVALMQKDSRMTDVVMLFLPALTEAMRWKLGQRPKATLFQRAVLCAVTFANKLGAISLASSKSVSHA